MLILIVLVVVLLILNLALVFKLLLCIDELKNGIIRIINKASFINADIDIINRNINNIDDSIRQKEFYADSMQKYGKLLIDYYGEDLDKLYDDYGVD